MRSAAFDVIAFSALGTLIETQQIAAILHEAMDGVDREKVFAETLCMISTVSARAAVTAFESGTEATTDLAESFLAIPLTLHSYVAGAEVLRREGQTQETVVPDTTELERMLTFYGVQLPESKYPDRKALRHVMTLWMGRVSPPGLNEHPEARVDRLELLDRVVTHARLIEAFARNAVQTA